MTSATRGGNPLVLGFPDYRASAMRLASALGVPYKEIQVHRFPDGETRLRLPQGLPRQAIICRSLNAPNEKLVELALAAATARELGVRRLALVAPYLCYMRQDKAFHPGEAVSQKVVGAMLAGHFDALVTVDPHLHRVAALGEAVPVRTPVALSAADPMAAFIRREVAGGLVIGPDQESAQWVEPIAAAAGSGHVVANKRRVGDREVEIDLPSGTYTGRDLVLVDDMASTGRTLEALIECLRPHRPGSISVMVTHALFFADALARLRRAGASRIWSTDSIPHSSNVILLDRLLAAGIESMGGWAS